MLHGQKEGNTGNIKEENIKKDKNKISREEKYQMSVMFKMHWMELTAD